MSATATGEDSADPAPSTSLPGGLLGRFRHLVHEFGKFGAVGAVAFAVDVVIFNAASVLLDLSPYAAKTVSTVLAATVAFLGNRFWTWRHRERSGLAREYVLYFLFNAVGLGIGLGCLSVSHDLLGSVWPAFRTLLADNISANIVGTVLGSLFRFWAYRRFVFLDATGRDVRPIGPSYAEKSNPLP
jgi:putative flippase GtrA